MSPEEKVIRTFRKQKATVLLYVLTGEDSICVYTYSECLRKLKEQIDIELKRISKG